MNTINTQDLINFLMQQNQTKTIELDKLKEMFFNKLKFNNRPGTINGYKECLKRIFRFLNNKNIKYTHQINSDVINEFISIRINNVKNVTINKEIKALKTMLNYGVELELIDSVGFKFKKLKETKAEIPVIKKDDINKIIKYLNTGMKDKKYKLAFLLMLSTGIRTTELLNIKNKNIDLKNKVIKLDFTKNGKERNIYIVDDLIDLIKEIMNDNIYLFNDKLNNQMTANNLRMFFKHIKEDLNIDVLSPHKIRHFYATTIYNNSLDIYLTSNLLGHSDIKMTQIYLDLDNNNNQQKNAQFNPLNYLDPLTS